MDCAGNMPAGPFIGFPHVGQHEGAVVFAQEIAQFPGVKVLMAPPDLNQPNIWLAPFC